MIAIVIRNLISENGRVGALARCSVELAKRINAVIITNGEDSKEFNLEGVKVYQIKGKGSGPDFLKKINILIRDLKIDLINFHGSLIGGLLSIKHFKKLDVPMVLNLYSYKARFGDYSNLKFKDFFQSFKRIFKHHFFFSLFVPKFLIKYYLANKNVKNVIVPSYRLKKFYDMDHVYRVSPGVDLKKFKKLDKENLKKDLGYKKEDKIIFFTGLGSYLRGIDDVILTFNNIKNKIKNIKLLLAIFSNKSELVPSKVINNIKNIVDKYQDIKIITKPIKNIEDYYNIADLVVLPYRFVGDIPECPLTMLEAMACEKPVITYRIGAIPEYANKCPVVGAKDVNKLGDWIIALLSNESLLEETGASARKFVEQEHSWDINAKKMEKIFRW